MVISAENKRESEQFMATLNDLLEIIDAIAPLITDNNYLQLCNGLKKLNDNPLVVRESVIEYIEVVRERVRHNRVVNQHQKRSRMKEMRPDLMLSDAYKLKNGWSVCERCDRIVIDVKGHQFSDICKSIKDTKRLTFSSKKLSTNDYSNSIKRLRAVFINYEGFKYWMNVIKKAM